MVLPFSRRMLAAVTVCVAVLSLAVAPKGLAAVQSGSGAAGSSIEWPGVDQCPDMVILSVRGSNELPQPDNGGDPLSSASYNADTAWGLGEPGELTAGEVQGEANGRGVTSVRQGVVYPALPVETAITDPDAYLASIKSGADALVDAILARFDDNNGCLGAPRFQIIGYSQGAWSVRIAMHWLAKHFSEPESHGMPYIAGVVLLGDPTYSSSEPIVRWDPTGGDSDLGIGWAAAFPKRVPASWYAPYSWMIRDRVSSYCLADDLVCRIPHRWEDLVYRALATKWATKVTDTHLSYGSQATVRAGQWLAKFVPPSTKAARAFAQQVLDWGQTGDADALWSVWDAYTTPERFISHMAADPGGVVNCYGLSRRDFQCSLTLQAYSPTPGHYALILGKVDGHFVIRYLDGVD
ncbi:cutinase family protein [Nocardioides panacisoli]|uniref:Cutinase family protein n=1 Tax=Nocardioides panacisoli TaxID=627624 RepID=A0ABP7J308_9ACTN